jgi:hypothetical protein
MNPLPSNFARLSLAACALALAACTRGCSCDNSTSELGATKKDPAPMSSVKAAHTVGGPVPRTDRLDKYKTTKDILGALSKDCLPCVEQAGCFDPAMPGGGVCETVPGTSKVSGQTEVALCLDALRCVFTTRCANNSEESQCLCGKTDIMSCMEGRAPPQGSCVDEFRRDFGDDNKKMYDDFINPVYGVGRANALIQCVIPSCSMCRIP